MLVRQSLGLALDDQGLTGFELTAIRQTIQAFELINGDLKALGYGVKRVSAANLIIFTRLLRCVLGLQLDGLSHLQLVMGELVPTQQLSFGYPMRLADTPQTIT